jgi:hypothetical protein
MIKKMHERGKLNDGETVEYASGLVMGTYRGLATVDHGGLDAGYRSDMIRFPDQHFTAACLYNSNAADPNQLTRKVAEIYLAKEMKPSDPAPVTNKNGVQLTPEQLRSKTGSYRNAVDGHVVRISVKDDKLQIGWGMSGESHELKTHQRRPFCPAARPGGFNIRALETGRSVAASSERSGGELPCFGGGRGFYALAQRTEGLCRDVQQRRDRSAV